MAKKYYWLKLKRDFFKRHDIRIIEELENGKDYILLYLKLLVESIDHNGELRFSDTIPYNDKMISTITNTNIDIVRNAMKVFSELGFVEMLDDETIYMSQVNELIGSESSSKNRVRQFRENRKAIEQHIPLIETFVNNKRYGGYYYKAFERDNRSCRICGNTDKLLMHHVIAYDSNCDDTVRLENLLTLCPSCHCSLHKNKKQALLPNEEILREINFLNVTELSNLALHVTNSNTLVTQELDKEKEKEKEIDKEKEKEEIIFDDFKNLEFKEPEYTDGQKRLIKAICDVFGISEQTQPQNYFLFINMLNLQISKGNYEWFARQINFYFLYKNLTNEKTHGFKTFIGDLLEPDKGAWNNENWEKKYQEAKKQKKEVKTNVQPGKGKRIGGSSTLKDIMKH